MIDSHCHLSQTDYETPVTDLIQEAQKQGVEKMLNIACDPNDWNELLQCIKVHKNIYGAIGIHPEYAMKDCEQALQKIPEIFDKNPKLLAVGEIGLDYSETGILPKKQQLLFDRQIQIAHDLNKPIIIHTRDAEKDTLHILTKAYHDGKLKKAGIIHCFTGSSELANNALQMGFYISISGIITFKSAHVLRDIVKEIPLDRLLVETDCPWLSPEPFRGQKNQPAYVVKTLEKVAELKGISPEKMNRITNENFERLFEEAKK